MTGTYELTRNIPVEDGYDLVVAGGGPAGATAAICAARLGIRVLLVESTGCMGGMGTSGLVTAFDPVGNGEEMLVGGLMREIIFKLGDRGFLKPGLEVESHVKRYHQWTPFRVEGYKLLLDELTAQAGVEVRFFSRVIDADADKESGRVNGVVIANVEGYRYVEAKTFIDATGDAVLSNIVGVEVREAGRDSPQIMPATLPSLFTGVDWDRSEFRPGPGMHGHDEYLFDAIADGHFTQPDKHLPGMSRVGDQIGYLNGGHLFNMNAACGRVAASSASTSSTSTTTWHGASSPTRSLCSTSSSTSIPTTPATKNWSASAPKRSSRGGSRPVRRSVSPTGSWFRAAGRTSGSRDVAPPAMSRFTERSASSPPPR